MPCPHDDLEWRQDLGAAQCDDCGALVPRPDSATCKHDVGDVVMVDGTLECICGTVIEVRKAPAL